MPGTFLAVLVVGGVLAFTLGDLRDQVRELGDRAQRREDLNALVDHAGGAGAIRGCAPVRTNQPMKAMVGWRVDVPLAHLADPPRPPAAILQASPGYAGEPPEPDIPPGFDHAAQAGDWTLATACR